MVRRLIVILFFGVSLNLYAQKIQTISGEYTYYPPESVTLENARQIAVQRAMIQALADNFGTVLSQNNTTIIADSKTDFNSISTSEVKGEWIETIGEPELNITYEGGMLVIRAKVKGKAREILTAAIDLKTKVLRNGTDDKYESEVFKHGDDLYLSFQSPVEGFLTVYLLDGNGDVFCLLPYRNATDGSFKVKAGKRYVFFSAKEVPQNESFLVDEYVMTTERSAEFNRIYIIFSKTEFVKAADNETEISLPRQLSFDDFNAWLVKNRRTDKDMQLIIKTIEIKK